MKTSLDCYTLHNQCEKIEPVDSTECASIYKDVYRWIESRSNIQIITDIATEAERGLLSKLYSQLNHKQRLSIDAFVKKKSAIVLSKQKRFIKFMNLNRKINSQLSIRIFNTTQQQQLSLFNELKGFSCE